MSTFVAPRRFVREASHDLFRTAAQLVSDPDERTVLDCSSLTFIDPLGLCVLRKTFLTMLRSGRQLRLRGLSLSIEGWCRRMGLFDDLENVEFADRTSAYRRHPQALIELYEVHDIAEVDRIALAISEAVVRRVPTLRWEPTDAAMEAPRDEQLAREVEYLFSEVLENALSHGRRAGHSAASAVVAAQYYAASQKLRLAIVDDGCGLLATLDTHPAMEGIPNDGKAIDLALLPKISCNRNVALGLSTTNAGIGLTICSSIAHVSGGCFGIWTGAAGKVKHDAWSSYEVTTPWHGTAVQFELDPRQVTWRLRDRIIRALPGFQEVPMLRFE